MQIDHITFSKTGGAGIVAQTIANAQRELGHDVNILTVVDSDLRSEPLRKPWLTLAAGLDEWLLASKTEQTLFSPLRGKLECLDLSKIRSDSIIHLHWMPGVMNHHSVKNLLDSGRKVVWTLHDMNPFTGGCHYSHDCTAFSGECRNCPQARRVFRKTVSLSLKNKSLERNYPRLRLVSPTTWMAEQARISAAFRGQASLVVPNPIDEVFFSQPSRLSQAKNVRGQYEGFVAVTIAKDLREPRKNIDFVIRALERASLDSGEEICLLMIGQNGNHYSSSRVRLFWLGELGAHEIAEKVSSVDVLLSGSLAESAGMTVVECAAMSVPSVALENGGTASQIQDGISGILARDFDSFVAGIVELILSPSKLSSLGASAKIFAENHQPEKVATRYIELYSSMA